MTSRPAVPAWRAAASLFTIIPVGGPAQVSPDTARRVAAWLPALGAFLGVVAGAILLAVEVGGHSDVRRLLAATLAISVLALLTGGLHLDGLADTVDGIGSRRPREEALAIMRRSDIGPLGVVALLLVVLGQIVALAALPPGWMQAAGLITAVITGRLSVLLATGLPAARPGGFGALIAGSASRSAQTALTLALLAAVAAAGTAAGGWLLAVRGLAAVITGLAVAALVCAVARRRLGGMTGDVFGALIELSTFAVLMVLALTA